MGRERFRDVFSPAGSYLNVGRVVTPGDYMGDGSANVVSVDLGPGESYAGSGSPPTASARRVSFNFLDTVAGLGDVSSSWRLTANVLTFTAGSKAVTA